MPYNAPVEWHADDAQEPADEPQEILADGEESASVQVDAQEGGYGPPASAIEVPTVADEPAQATALWVPAGFLLRLGAFLIDMILLLLLLQLVLLIIGFHQPDPSRLISALERLLEEPARRGVLSATTLAMIANLRRPLIFAGWMKVAMCLCYFTLFHGIAGATWGKFTLRLRVMRQDGRPLGLGLAFARYVAYFLLARLAYGAWTMPFDRQRRTLYDMALGTNVFRPLQRYENE